MALAFLRVLISLAVISAVAPLPARSQAPSRPTAALVRQHLARRLGTWITSNAAYRTPENGEPKEYGTHFVAGLGGVSATGCLWGETDGAVAGVYWHFFTGWDPETETMIVYQTGASGIVGIGHEPLAAGEQPDEAEQLFAPLPGDAGPPGRVRHRSTWIGTDTLRTESFNWTDEAWTARRTYVWVRSRQPAPC